METAQTMMISHSVTNSKRLFPELIAVVTRVFSFWSLVLAASYQDPLIFTLLLFLELDILFLVEAGSGTRSLPTLFLDPSLIYILIP